MVIPHIVVLVAASLTVLGLLLAAASAGSVRQRARPERRRARSRRQRAWSGQWRAWSEQLRAWSQRQCAWSERRRAWSRRQRAWSEQRRARSEWERRDRPALRRLDGALRDAHVSAPAGEPSLAQVQAQLRRLDAQRRGGPTGGSRTWTAAVDRAYDQWLRLACDYLAVTAHLPVTGGDDRDRDLERLRVEAKLAEAGLRIRPAHRPPR